ncbi:glycosyltransferase family 4 protein [Candidatus Kaiserbacteria bacterium]|nr:glycosyltransferase family 4 protein [Candidatus Kaiserbacteria bacterium]
MHILITTGIFEPEAGGPAIYTPKIASMLVGAGHDVTVITYSHKDRYDFDSKYSFKLVRVVRKGSRIANYLTFFRAVRKEIGNADLIYSLDWIAAGFPVVLAAMLKPTPIIIRVGGDYIWERYLENTNDPMPLTDFYEKKLDRNFRMLYRVIRFVLRRAHVVFNSDAQQKMYHQYYSLDPRKTSVIYNPLPKISTVSRGKASEEILFAGRFVAMKNVTSLVWAFAKAQLPDSYRLVLIGSGPEEHRIRNAMQELRIVGEVTMLPTMRQEELCERIKNCRALVLPSWSDISPNQVTEALALGVPVLVTKENFLPIKDQLPEMLDPRSVEDIASKLEMLADEKRYGEFVAKCRKVRFEHSWDAVLQEHMALFRKFTAH